MLSKPTTPAGAAPSDGPPDGLPSDSLAPEGRRSLDHALGSRLAGASLNDALGSRVTGVSLDDALGSRVTGVSLVDALGSRVTGVSLVDALGSRVTGVSLDRDLCARLTGFVSLLRENGFSVGVDDATLLVEAAGHIGVLDPLVLRWSAQALLCRRAADQQRFADLFDSWFLPPNRRQLVESRGGGVGALERGDVGRTASEDNSEGMPASAPDDAGAASSEQGKTSQRGASSDEALAHADFRHLHQPQEMRALDALMRGFAIRLRKLTLRRETAGGSRRIDIPGTARRSVSHGGEPIELVYRQRRQTPPRLVLLLDVSRSMNLYSFFFLRLARALQGVRLDTRVFIWHTRLSGVSEALRDPDPWRAQERLQLLSAGWAGGTRIGECLEQFEREHSALVHSRTALIVVSDGYDTGEPTLLANVVRRLRHRARRLVWLNPLAASDDYAPLARGMQAVLPELDLFAAANNLSSIERVLPQLVLALR